MRSSYKGHWELFDCMEARITHWRLARDAYSSTFSTEHSSTDDDIYSRSENSAWLSTGTSAIALTGILAYWNWFLPKESIIYKVTGPSLGCLKTSLFLKHPKVSMTLVVALLTQFLSIFQENLPLSKS